MSELDHACGSIEHFNRRSILKMAGLSGLSWLTPLASGLARNLEHNPMETSKALIILWLEGAASQLETFDPHPGTEIAAGSKARKTKAKGILIGDGFEQLADQMDSVSLVRALTSKEGDHARAIYNIKTGYRPDTTLVHPAIGSVICHQMESADSGRVDIPRHVSILPGQSPARGGYLGDRYDAFKIGDPLNPVPDVQARVERQRQLHRISDLNVVDSEFLRNRRTNKIVEGSLGNHNLDAALKMMSSQQLEAFEVGRESESVREEYGDTPFGRGCLAAVRLIASGVRCVEVTLGGWDTHANNHQLQAGRINILDPAFAAVIRDLRRRQMLDSTMVVCGGEFGRTPWLNSVGGRDHWPQGFAIAMAGGGIKGGRVVGETSPNPNPDSIDPAAELKDSHPIEDIHATIFEAMGIDFHKELRTPIGRPMKICQGQPINELF